MRTRMPRVLVLYVHPLLGEGLARILTAQAGVRARAVAARDVKGRAAALRQQPDLIIAETTDDNPAFETSESRPVVFVRLDGDDAVIAQPLADPDLIIALARGLAEPAEVASLAPRSALAAPARGE